MVLKELTSLFESVLIKSRISMELFKFLRMIKCNSIIIKTSLGSKNLSFKIKLLTSIFKICSKANVYAAIDKSKQFDFSSSLLS